MSQQTSSNSPQRLWSIDFVLNLLTAHFLFVSYTSLFTVIPKYVLELDGEEWQIGIIVGSFGIMGLLVRPFAGRWVYMLGAKRVAFAGAFIFTIASALYIAAPGVWWLVPVRILQGMGLAIAPVATTTIVANLAPSHRRAEAMSYMGNSIAMSNLYAPVLGFWLLSHGGFPASFVFSASGGALAAILALRISTARTRFPSTGPTDDRVPLISRAALFPAVIFLTYTFTTAPVNTFLPLLAEQRGLGNPGLFFTLFSSTTMLSMMMAGPIADRLGRPAVITPGLLLVTSAMFTLMMASNQPMFLGAGFLTGLGFGMLQPGLQSLTVDRVRPRERGSAMATLQSAWDIGGSGGAFALGPVAGALGVAAPFGVVAVGTLAGTAGFLFGNARSPTILPGKRDAPSPGDD